VAEEMASAAASVAVGGGGPKEAGSAPTAAATMAERRERARLMTYRLFPLWLFLLTFGITVVWEAAVRGHEITSDKLQAAALIALGVALFIGAPVGIRFFNPLPPKT
jgi:hypothetical protein